MNTLATTTELLGGTNPRFREIWEGVERWGSFAVFVVAAMFLMWGIAQLIPAIGKWLSKIFDTFVSQLQLERESRERNEAANREALRLVVQDFRDMLKDHNETITAAVNKQTTHLDGYLQANNKELQEIKRLAQEAAKDLETENKKHQ